MSRQSARVAAPPGGDALRFLQVALLAATPWLVTCQQASGELTTPAPAPASQINELLRMPHPDDDTKEIILVRVELPPGGKSRSHTHPGFIVGYVLAGGLEFQLADEALRVFKPGDAFYEAPRAKHVLSRNPSSSAPTQFVAFTVQERGKPLSLPID